MNRYAAGLLCCVSLVISGCSTPGPKDCGTPQKAIEHGLYYAKKGDVETVKNCFAPEFRDKITAEVIDKVKSGEIKSMSFSDLVDKVEESDAGGRKTAKIKMKNGRTLTTMRFENGQWMAETLWFR